VITSLAWCPKKNHLAWTDNNGEFFQWHNPISDTQPDPVKWTSVSNNSTTIPVKPKSGLDLFGEEPANTKEQTAATGDGTADVDVDADDDYDNWIVDDLGGGMQDEPVVGRPTDGYIKEMGMTLCSVPSRLPHFVAETWEFCSQYYQGPATFSAWINPYGKQEMLFGCVLCSFLFSFILMGFPFASKYSL
jgi:hypothetical protein